MDLKPKGGGGCLIWESSGPYSRPTIPYGAFGLRGGGVC